ncbi:AAA family ATPase [Arthrobacter sp. AQ5-05]|uniref:helix-turn-helix transcriptional regulator n=1 Tax=Arthrobacter sp. AQ5-05 TaxID=2184581 RepID=UPI0015EC4771|nr:AAA family ATPase [Arthrobacter sp. AQ5-05]
MAPDREWTSPELVGRATELGEIDAVLRGAHAGTAVTLVVSGDPGVGKTTLINRACSNADSAASILFGGCLPLASISVPFLPLRTVIRGSPPVGGIPHPVFGTSGQTPDESIVALDDWLTEISRARPVVLVVDDLHWADPSTLDALMYLIAGPGDRRLSILATLRNVEVGEGHPLQRWLADIRRMPRVSWLELGPLDYRATGAQLAQVLGSAPHQSLIREVFSHTAGNPYLNRLMVGGLRADTRHLPAQLPVDLRTAVLRSWHSLTPEARELTELMAVGGRPQRAEDLDEFMQQSGPRCNVLAFLREAADAGIAECDAGGALWWFHHPLIAEALEQGLDEGRRRRWHAVFAAHEERRLGEGVTARFGSLAALAHHHDAAGNFAEAYRWTLRAATATNEASGTVGKLPLLRRALELQDILGHEKEEREWLLNRMRAAAADTGAMEDELEAVEALISEITAVDRPLEASELMVRQAQLRFTTGQEFLSISRMSRAVQLASANKQSWQYALALAELAVAELWREEPDGQVHASEALRAARRAGNPRALSYAYVANAMASLNSGNLTRGREAAALGVEAATRTRDFMAMFSAIVWQANVTESFASQTYADFMRAGRGIMANKGSPHVYLATLAGFEAGAYLAIGRWTDCALALRVALGSDPGAMGDVLARLTAAQLAVRQGKQSEAEAHLARAEELSAQASKFMNHKFDDIRAEVYLAAGNPEAAYTTIMRYAKAELPAEYMTEASVPLAARALADRIERARDEGSPTADLLAFVDDLLQLFPRVLQEEFDTELFKTQMQALNGLFRAEVGRARSSSENGRQWVAAADACRDATLRWEEAYCCWRAVQAMLLHANSQRGPATEILRRGLELAEQLQARPIQASLMQIAAQARIAILRPAPGASAGGMVELPGLTPRERELLGFVVSGLTYAEIARTLVISEKTVSTHVSNMLRKTGTANRLDLSQLATRQRNDPTTRTGRP